MYQVSQANGIHIGTVLLGAAPVTELLECRAGRLSSSIGQQIRALRGDLTRTSAGPNGLRYIQGAGPITLSHGEAQDVWLAVVAGLSRSQLIANANAARDHVSKLQNTAISDVDETIRIAAVRTRTAPLFQHPSCKKNCRDTRP